MPINCDKCRMTHINSFDTAAHRLLDDLDARHEQLLSDLDALNARVDHVLSQYTQVVPDSRPVEPLAEHDEDE